MDREEGGVREGESRGAEEKKENSERGRRKRRGTDGDEKGRGAALGQSNQRLLPALTRSTALFGATNDVQLRILVTRYALYSLLLAYDYRQAAGFARRILSPWPAAHVSSRFP
ncbi:predicted protein [Histoplasma capsulatum var. duboisii H88]|uniref:Predicted protein n=2 Tax=Ajellomyces capsulatus TaxID=5037 RepID=F0ULT7_AJEC8|nr:predicted protein [Histoplasma capsulatum H143]EGC47187.1 predicted protein [Histoplasma capsulatum var. duboisii H88]